LHGNIRNLLLQPSSKSKSKRSDESNTNDNSLNATQRISLAQSAVICIDTLAKHFSKLVLKFKALPKETKEKWEKIFNDSLVEIISVSSQLSLCLHKESATGTTNFTTLHKSILGIAGSMELAKILGSNYLLCTSLCSVLGSAKCLPLLSVRIL
jgi:hypothetical protein